jgi:hypothetical protein
LLDVRDLLALRLVTRKTRAWVDAVKPKHQAFTLYVSRKTDLDELMDEKMLNRVPFFRRLVVKDSSFFLLPLIPKFLHIYGPQLHTIYRNMEAGYPVPAEIAFYWALPNLTQLSTHWLGSHFPNVIIPKLERLQLVTMMYDYDERTPRFNFDFLLNFPNLRELWLPCVDSVQYVEILSTLAPYFAIRNGWMKLMKGSSRRMFAISASPRGTLREELNPTEKVAILLEELAAANGAILIEKMPVNLLADAVHLFNHQPGKLSSFGKCIRSLYGVSSSLYDVELPNMRKFEVDSAFEGTARDGNFARKVSWPKLVEVKIEIGGMKDLRYMKQLLFESGVRLSVQRLTCNLNLLSLWSNEDHLLLRNLPNLTHLRLIFGAEDVGLFRSLIRILPMTCSKIQFLALRATFLLRDLDFLGVDGEGLTDFTPHPLLQFPGKLRVCSLNI